MSAATPQACTAGFTTALIGRDIDGALAYLTDERKAMMDDFHKTIGGEQRALGSEIDQLSVRIVDHAIDRMERFVWEMLAAIVGALFGGIVLVRVLFGRPSAAAGRQLV